MAGAKRLINSVRFRRLAAPPAALLIAIVLAPPAHADGRATAEIRQAPSADCLIRVGKAYLDPDNVIEPAMILVRGGEIAAIGQRMDAPDDLRIIDAPDAVVTAGLIDANVNAAAFRNYTGPEQETECTPELRVLDAIDLDDRLLAELAASGVTTIYVSAEPTAVIGARGCILRTGGPIAARVLDAATGIKVSVGREPIYRRGFNRGPFGQITHMTRRPTTRMGLVWTIRKSFHDAQAAERGESPGTRGEGSPSDEALPHLVSALKGKEPIRVQARQLLDIQTALRVANEFSFTFILEEGTDAPRCVDALEKLNVPVIYGPIFDYPSGFRAGTGETRNHRYSAPAELRRAGLTMALSAGDMTGEAGLPQQAAYAVRFGLSRAQALAAVTTTPAKLLGINERAGTLAKGRPADLVVWSGEPFEATTRAMAVLIGGHIVVDRAAE